jgi:endonuclease I
MRCNATRGASLLLVLGVLQSCSDPSVKGALDEPYIADPSKADDFGDSVLPIGRLPFSGEVFGEFTEDGQLDGYFFTAEAGAVITVDNSNLGTSRNLDSTLFLYGPMNEDGHFGSEPLVSDDDSGWGTHARIRDFVVPERGDYLVVISTYLEIDRGRYRLGLICEGPSCVVPCDTSCNQDDPCSGQICDSDHGCISQELPLECSDEPVLISATEVVTSEAGERDSFSVRLTAEPEDHVVVWVETSDPDEAVVYPIQIFFCLPGYIEGNNGCELPEEGQETVEEHWRRQADVRVTGVNDAETDGDATFTISFQVVSNDENYGQLALPDMDGFNLDRGVAIDYSPLEGLYDEELLLALHGLVSGHEAYGYQGKNSARTLMFSAVDLHDGLVESIYNGATIERPRESSVAYGMGFNTEHSWPQGQFDRLEPMKSDLHHIFPSDVSSNSSRSSYDYGMNTVPTSQNSQLGRSTIGRGQTVYQVRPERRGDVARAHFYMVARYGSDELELEFDDDVQSLNGCINDDEELVLRQWHEDDPVDDLERTRNNRIEAFQGNRNPFIDRPELVAAISDF